MPTLPLTNVLLIDDDSTTNYLNKLLLTTSMQVATHVQVAENGHEALVLLAQVNPVASPQLILLDMNMPVMNGQEFLRVYQQLPAAQRRATVVIMLTTSLHERDQLLIQHLPVAGFVTKPLTRAKVVELLAQHFPQAA